MLQGRVGRIRIGVMVLGLATAIGCNRAAHDGTTQTGAQGDTAAQLREADTTMNAVAAKVEDRLSGDDKQRFVEAEEAWLTYRDAHCDAEKALHDGSADQPSIEAACLARLTDQRRSELQRVYKTD